MSNKPTGFVVSLIFYLLIGGGGLLADLWTKSWAFENYYPYYQEASFLPIDNNPHWIIDDVFGIQTSTNGGALFGVMQGYQTVFIALSLIALVSVIAWLFIFQAWRDRWLLFCLAIISGGILGNLYDRLGWWHQNETPPEAFYEVRDWIHFRLAGIPYFDPWPNFNIADSLLVVGVGMMLVQSIFMPAEAKSSEETPLQDQEPAEDSSKEA